MLRRLLLIPLVAAALSLFPAQAALAESVPSSPFGGSYYAQSADGSTVGYLMPDSRLRWEVNGVPISNYGIDDEARMASVAEDPSALVRGGATRGEYYAASSDGSWMAYQMPDGTLRWEHHGVPMAAQSAP